MTPAPGNGLAGYYRRLPEELRRRLRPLTCVDEFASLLPPRAREPIQRTTEMARRVAHLRRVRYRLRRLDGAAPNGAPLSVLLACDELSARYWTQALFRNAPHAEVIGTYGPLAGLRVARRLAETVDLSLWQTPWPLARLAPRALHVPSWIPLWLPTDRPVDAIVTGDRSGRAARKNDVRRVARAGLAPRLVREADAVERFYDELYTPYVRARFGTLGIVQPRHVFRHARRHGWLLVLEDVDGVRSGALLEPHGAELRVLAFGAAGDDRQAQAGIEAAYYHAIRLAVERGFGRLALGTSRPVLTDGVLRYKRKWGGHVAAPTTFDRYVLRARAVPAVQSLLAAVPLVVERRDGRLAALVGHDGVDVAGLLARVDVPGLAELLLVGADDAPPSPAPYSPVRAIPRESPLDDVAASRA